MLSKNPDSPSVGKGKVSATDLLKEIQSLGRTPVIPENAPNFLRKTRNLVMGVNLITDKEEKRPLSQKKTEKEQKALNDLYLGISKLYPIFQSFEADGDWKKIFDEFENARKRLIMFCRGLQLEGQAIHIASPKLKNR